MLLFNTVGHFFYAAAKTMANIILVHEDKVSGPNSALTINTLTMNVFGMSGERTPEAQREGTRPFRVQALCIIM